MPKQKTRKAVAKRFKKTGTGKYKHKSPGLGHLLSGKSGKRKRQLRKQSIASPADSNRIGMQIAD
jgi:large subunit ribosomal protein L35